MKVILISIILILNLEFAHASVKLGIDVLKENSFMQLKGMRIALLTNFAGRTNKGELSIDAFLEQENCTLDLILTPEHGLFTTIPAGVKVEDSDYKGISIHSLYGNSRNPDVRKFANIDAIVVDLQDVGVRSYTYLSTMYNTMITAAKLKKKIIILDRPNPIGGNVVDGNVAEENLLSFVSIIPISYIHGCTLAELAMMINEENWLPDNLKADLTIIKMKGWSRNMSWENTDLYWFPTSPNVPTIQAVRGLATLGIIGELGIISIGIGTTSPFQYIGIMHKNENELLNNVILNGVELHKTKYRPFFAMYSGKDVNGYFLQFNQNNFEPFSNSVKILYSLRKNFPDLFDTDAIKENSKSMFEKVTASKSLLKAIIDGRSAEFIYKLGNQGLDKFKELRKKYLLYWFNQTCNT